MFKGKIKILGNILLVLFIISILIITVPSCKKEEEVIKIGAILPLSGGLATIGEPKKRAMDIAESEINSIQNKKTMDINIVYEDNKGTPKDGVAAFQKLLSTTDIKYYYIDLTTVVNSCAPIINENQVLTFAGSAQPEVTELSKWIFRVFAGGEQEIDMIVEYLLNNKIKKIYVLYTDEIYGNSAYEYIKKKFESIGGKVIGSDKYNLAAKDVKDILVKAKNSKAERIIVLGYGIVFPTILKQMRELNISASNVVMNLGATNVAVVALENTYTNDITFVGPSFTYLLNNNELTHEMTLFIDEYKKRFNEIPDFRAAYAYDVIKVLYTVWEKVGSDDLNKVAAEIVKLKDYQGASGKISFLESGDSYTDLVLAQYKNGEMILLGD